MDGILGEAIAITGNDRALLKLGPQAGRALDDPGGAHPFEVGICEDVYGTHFEGAVKRAKSPEEMEDPTPRPYRTPVSTAGGGGRRRLPGVEEGEAEASVARKPEGPDYSMFA